MAKKPRVSRKYPTNNADFLVFSQHVHTQSSQSKWLKTSAAKLTALATAIVVANTAQDTALTRTKGAVAARKPVFEALKNALDAVADDVDDAAKANPGHEIEIIEDCGFDATGTNVRGKQVFWLGPGDNPGEVKGMLPVYEEGAMNFVQYTIDNKTWIDVHESTNTHFTIKGLPLHAVISVRYRSTGHSGKTDWSTPVEYVVTK